MSTPEGIDRRQALRRVGALLGGIVSAPTVAGVLSGCERVTGPDWSPQTLTAAQNEMVDTIAEIIIPTTDTPGASAANVNRFIDAMVGDSYLPKDRKRFLNGLEDVNARCKENYGAPFVECTDEQQRALVAELDDETFGRDASAADRETPPFFRMMKELVIIGYYTSEIGATQELKTNIVPGYYDGDVPYKKIGRAWA
ncbi:MAG: gluconate 2-dehydrogenase subunit 3 family protein [Salinibacter sp.]